MCSLKVESRFSLGISHSPTEPSSEKLAIRVLSTVKKHRCTGLKPKDKIERNMLDYLQPTIGLHELKLRIIIRCKVTEVASLPRVSFENSQQ